MSVPGIETKTWRMGEYEPSVHTYTCDVNNRHCRKKKTVKTHLQVTGVHEARKGVCLCAHISNEDQMLHFYTQIKPT